MAVTAWEKERVRYVAEAKGTPHSILFRTMSLEQILTEADRLDAIFAKRVNA